MNSRRNFSPVRTAVRALVRIYYPKIEISERQRIPTFGPALLVANHANSLIDPVILGLTAARRVHFLAKAPLFEIPVFGRALRALGMVPAYRGSDDPTQVKSNLKSLSAAADFLQRNEAVGIFPEGKSHDATKVDRVKSGAARIAVAAFKNGADSLTIVPVGINYERKESFNSSIWVRVGEPISMSDWVAKQTGDDHQILRALTTEIDRRLKEVVVHLNEESWEPFLRDLEILVPPKNKKQPVAAIRQRKRIADGINYFAEHDRHRVARVAVGIKRFREKLDSLGVKMNSPLFWSRGWRRPLRMFWNTLWLILVSIPAFLGAAHNILPFCLVRGITSLLRQPGKMTLSLARLGIGIPIYGAWYFLVWRWMAGYFLPWIAWTWVAIMPFAGVLALTYFLRAKQNLRVWKEHFLLLTNQSKVARLRADQDVLRAQLSELNAAYSKISPDEPVVAHETTSPKMVFKVALRWVAILAVVASLALWGGSFLKYNRLPELQSAGPNWSNVSTEALSMQLGSDEQSLAEIIRGLHDLEIRAAELRREFESERRTYYSQADDDKIRQLLFSYLTYRTELLRFIWKYQNYAQVADEKLRLQTFLIELTAASALYDASLKFVAQHQHPDAIRKLNEGEPIWGIPPRLYDTVRANLAHPQNRRLLKAAWQNYEDSLLQFTKFGLTETVQHKLFHQTIEQSMKATAKLDQLVKKWNSSSPLEEAHNSEKKIVYRGQSLISTWVGDTRIRQPRQGKPLIQPGQLDELRAKLKPGDILIERQNWYLSRAFMPGYWAHAAIYVGTTNDLLRMGLDKDPRVQKFWKEFAARDADGHEHVILEAVPSGVRMTTLEHCIGIADSAAVMRPRIRAERLPEVIAKAFVHLGKPYDFEFDFFSTDKLVCTELVYRCCGEDIQFQLVDVMGRKTLPPTELVRKLFKEHGTTNAQLDFIGFLDGDEKTGSAKFQNENVFLETLHRPSLTWLQ